ncbi:MAG: hypothetical protein AAF568_12235 [Pseudomonadota bacterium]
MSLVLDEEALADGEVISLVLKSRSFEGAALTTGPDDSLWDLTSPQFTARTATFLVDAILASELHQDVDPLMNTFRRDYRARPVRERAAIMSGFRRILRAPHGPLDAPIPAWECLSVDKEKTIQALVAQVQAASEVERDAIAHADGYSPPEEHRRALDQVIDEQGCLLTPEQTWYPSEAVELAAYGGGEPGFATAIALLLVNALSGTGGEFFLEGRWGHSARHYLELPAAQRGPVIAAFRYLFEADPDWEAEQIEPRRSTKEIPAIPPAPQRFLARQAQSG